MSEEPDNSPRGTEGSPAPLEGRVLADRLDAVLDGLRGTDARAWIVGGTVRDLLLGARGVADLDVVVDGDSLRIARRIAAARGWRLVVLDEPRGTARIVAGPHARIDVNAMVGDSILSDLSQRDLTINALALRVREEGAAETVIDPCGGLDDLENGLIRLTSERALVDDPLRILRVFRFSTALGFIIVPETLRAVEQHATLLARVAPERVVIELAQILADSGSAAVLRRMDEVGVLEAAVPEIGSMRRVEQNPYHHLDVLDHSILALDRFERLLGDLASVFGVHDEEVEAFLRQNIAAARPRLVSVKLAVLLHDVGKPSTRSTKAGRTTFYRHNAKGESIAVETCRRLRLSAAETEDIAFYVRRHMVPGDVEKQCFEADEKASERSIVRFASRYRERGLVLALLSVADSMAMAGPLADPTRPERLRRFASRVAAAYYCEVAPRTQQPPLIRGTDLIEEFGLTPGPRIGSVLATVRERQLEGRLASREDALGEVLRILEEEAAETTDGLGS